MCAPSTGRRWRGPRSSTAADGQRRRAQPGHAATIPQRLPASSSSATGWAPRWSPTRPHRATLVRDQQRYGVEEGALGTGEGSKGVSGLGTGAQALHCEASLVANPPERGRNTLFDVSPVWAAPSSARHRSWSVPCDGLDESAPPRSLPGVNRVPAAEPPLAVADDWRWVEAGQLVRPDPWSRWTTDLRSQSSRGTTAGPAGPNLRLVPRDTEECWLLRFKRNPCDLTPNDETWTIAF